MTEKAKDILDDLVSQITSEKIAKFVMCRLFSDGVNIPCKKWSYLNQFVTYLSGTGDARGIKQWSEAGRSIKKGTKAIYILVPMIYKIENKKTKIEEDHLTGFKAMPVFRLEDTEGKDLDYVIKLREFNPEAFPLIEVARNLGIEVKAGLTGDAGGWYFKNSITMGCNNGQVFLHELSHAIDGRLPEKSEDRAYNEVVAELSAAFLASLYGDTVEIENTIAYIRGWSSGRHVAFELVKAMERVEKIYKFIESLGVVSFKVA